MDRTKMRECGVDLLRLAGMLYGGDGLDDNSVLGDDLSGIEGKLVISSDADAEVDVDVDESSESSSESSESSDIDLSNLGNRLSESLLSSYSKRRDNNFTVSKSTSGYSLEGHYELSASIPQTGISLCVKIDPVNDEVFGSCLAGDLTMKVTDGSILSIGSKDSFNSAMSDYKKRWSDGFRFGMSVFNDLADNCSSGLSSLNEDPSLRKAIISGVDTIINNMCSAIQSYSFLSARGEVLTGSSASRVFFSSVSSADSSDDVDIDESVSLLQDKKSVDEIIEYLLTGGEIDEELRHRLAGFLVELKNYRQHGCKKTPKTESPSIEVPPRYPSDPSHPDVF